MVDSQHSEDERRQLANLDNTVIAIPLLEKLNADTKGRERYRVIVELNVLHQAGRRETKQHVEKMIADIAGKRAINKTLSDDTDHYVFARLNSGQIRRLAKRNEEQRSQAAPQGDSPADYNTRVFRPIFKIWPDFEVELLLTESVSTVKADAARAAFAASGRGIIWAVIDSGIEGTHPHFQAHKNLELSPPLTHYDYSGSKPVAIASTDQLTDEIGHGTHVAGIIAGEYDARNSNTKPARASVRCRNELGSPIQEEIVLSSIRGIAPECKIVSLRVVDKDGRTHTSNIIAALGYVRRINGDGRLPHINGVNISLGHPFDPEWFGCGQSPLCVEVDRLVRSGTVVVAAAGNGGYGTVSTKFKGSVDAGLTGTIRDPGNANLAITVGSTHRDMPHVYGVSYFSAKGPTGDGRLKPDIVAPGERIISCAAKAKRLDPEHLYVDDSGTSMAAPHVSGCIAAFLSIRREFKNQPERVKEIFLSTATDLGREHYFQGRGLVDLMRAIQSI
jgi:subtilisin family serine protease